MSFLFMAYGRVTADFSIYKTICAHTSTRTAAALAIFGCSLRIRVQDETKQNAACAHRQTHTRHTLCTFPKNGDNTYKLPNTSFIIVFGSAPYFMAFQHRPNRCAARPKRCYRLGQRTKSKTRWQNWSRKSVSQIKFRRKRAKKTKINCKLSKVCYTWPYRTNCIQTSRTCTRNAHEFVLRTPESQQPFVCAPFLCAAHSIWRRAFSPLSLLARRSISMYALLGAFNAPAHDRLARAHTHTHLQSAISRTVTVQLPFSVFGALLVDGQWFCQFWAVGQPTPQTITMKYSSLVARWHSPHSVANAPRVAHCRGAIRTAKPYSNTASPMALIYLCMPTNNNNKRNVCCAGFYFFFLLHAVIFRPNVQQFVINIGMQE